MSASSVAALEHGTVDAGVLLASAVTAFEERHTSNPFIADTRTLAGARQVFGSEMFPSLSLLAENRWLRANPDTAQRLARAVKKGMGWVRDRPAGQVRQMIPDAARMSEKADLQTIQRMQQGISTDGLMSVASAELVEKFVAVSNPRVRAAHIDPAKIFTNEFASVR
jgi:NitT/TauT family transport system substrate-binding protein